MQSSKKDQSLPIIETHSSKRSDGHGTQRKTFTRNTGKDYSKLEALPVDLRGKRIQIFVNGDYVRYGIQFPVPRWVSNMKTLLGQIQEATQVFTTHLYTPTGKRIRKIDDIIHGNTYVSAGNEPFRKMTYVVEGQEFDAAHTASVPQKAGHRKTEEDYSRRMKNLHFTESAKRITIVTLHALTSPVKITLTKKDLISWNHFLYNLSTKVNLPHGNGAVRELLDLNGEEMSSCEQIGNGETYLALGSFRYSEKVVEARLKELRDVNGAVAEADAKLKASRRSRSKSSRRIPPTQYSHDSGDTGISTAGKMYAEDAKIRVKPIEDVERQILAIARQPATIQTLWNKLDTSGTTTLPLASFRPLFNRTYPKLLTVKFAWVPAFEHATSRSGVDKDAVLGRGEFRAFMVYLVYFSKAIIILRDRSAQSPSTLLNFHNFHLGLQLLHVEKSLSEVAAAFDYLDEKKKGVIEYSKMCAWLAREASPHGVRITDIAEPSAGSIAAWSALEEQLKTTASSPSEMEKLWERINFNALDVVDLKHITQKIGDVSRLLSNKRAWNSAYDGMLMITGQHQPSEGTNSNELPSVLTETRWVERSEFQFLLLAGFTSCKLYSVLEKRVLEPGYTFDLDTFVRTCSKCDIDVDREGAIELMEHIDEDKTGTINFIEFLVTVAHHWFGDLLSFQPELDMVHTSGAAPLDTQLEAEDDTSEVNLDKTCVSSKEPFIIRPATKGRRKIIFKTFSKYEKDLRHLIFSPDLLEELFVSIDTNGSGILSIHEIEHFLSISYPILKNQHALISTFELSTRQINHATVEKDGKIEDVAGDAWVAMTQFQEFMGFLLYLNKLYVLLNINQPTRGEEIDFETYFSLLQVTGIKLKSSEIRTNFVALQTGQKSALVQFDDFAKWYCQHCLYRGNKTNKRSISHGSGQRRRLPTKQKKANLQKIRDLILLEPEIEAILSEPYKMEAIWDQLGPKQHDGSIALLDFHRSLAAIYPILTSESLANRAFRGLFQRLGTQGLVISSSQFRVMTATIFSFHQVYTEVGVDCKYDYSLNHEEFMQLLRRLRLKFERTASLKEFEGLDSFDFGLARLDSVGVWYAQKRFPNATTQKRMSFVYDSLQKEFNALAQSTKRVFSLFKQIDQVGKDVVSLESILAFIGAKYPLMNNKAAIISSFRMATGKEAYLLVDEGVGKVMSASGHKELRSNQFRRFMLNLLFFHKVFDLLAICKVSDTRWLTFSEFAEILVKIGVEIPEEMAKREFSGLSRKAKKQEGKSGVVRAEEVSHWISMHVFPDSNPAGETKVVKSPSKHGMRDYSTLSSRSIVPVACLPREERLQKFHRLETELFGLINSDVRLSTLWDKIDVNCNGTENLLRVVDAVSETYPFMRSVEGYCLGYECATGKVVDTTKMQLYPVHYDTLGHILVFSLYGTMLLASTKNVILDDRKQVIDIHDFSRVLDGFDLEMQFDAVSRTFSQLPNCRGGVPVTAVCKWVLMHRQKGF